jgi:hypothetical protein
MFCISIVLILDRNQDAVVVQPTVQQYSTPSSTPQPTLRKFQKINFIHRHDGKYIVRGLLPGQQIIKTPDGNIFVLNRPDGKC